MILPAPLPPDFEPGFGPDFPVPRDPRPSKSPLGSGREIICPLFSRLLSPKEIAEIKVEVGAKKDMYLFAVVTYKDTFGHPRRLRFFERIWWRRDGPKSVSVGGYSDAD
jgi:hypothetical protein